MGWGQALSLAAELIGDPLFLSSGLLLNGNPSSMTWPGTRASLTSPAPCQQLLGHGVAAGEACECGCGRHQQRQQACRG